MFPSIPCGLSTASVKIVQVHDEYARARQTPARLSFILTISSTARVPGGWRSGCCRLAVYGFFPRPLFLHAWNFECFSRMLPEEYGLKSNVCWVAWKGFLKSPRISGFYLALAKAAELCVIDVGTSGSLGCSNFRFDQANRVFTVCGHGASRC